MVTICAGFQRHAKLAQFIGEPGQRDAGIAQHVLAVTDELLAAHADDGPLLDQVQRAPVRGRRRSQHEQMRAGIVGNDLRCAGADEIRKPRIRNLDRRMQRVDRVEHLLHGIGRGARRQIDAHAKGEFGFGDAHFVARHRSRAAIWYHGLGQDASGHRAVDIDVLLSGLAGGCDLPAEQTSGRISFDCRLDRIASMRSCGRNPSSRPANLVPARQWSCSVFDAAAIAFSSSIGFDSLVSRS